MINVHQAAKRGVKLAIRAAAFAALCGLSACGSSDHDDNTHTLGGSVRGLWNGADGVALKLQADGVDTLLTVQSNGAFQFPARLAPGTSYSVTILTLPYLHTCVVDAAGNGVVENANITSVSVACTGPELSLAFSGNHGWTFDPTRNSQTFDGSVFIEEVALTVTGLIVTGAKVNGADTALGAPSRPVALTVGMTPVIVEVTAPAGLSNTYTFNIRRGQVPLAQLAYGKPSRTGTRFRFGSAMALDGDTLVVGAPQEALPPDSGGADIAGMGAVYVFVRTGDTWTQQARLTPPVVPDNGAVLHFGSAVAMSGNTLAIGAPGDGSSSRGPVGGDPRDVGAFQSGAVFVYVRSGTLWTQQAYVKASNTGVMDSFGTAVALSGDLLAVGAPFERSSASGVNPPGGQENDDAQNAGAIYVLRHNGVTWSQEAYVKPSTTRAGDNFGAAVALFADTLAVGAPGESSSARNVGGAEDDTSAPGAGAAYVFIRNGSAWSQQAYVKASNTAASDQFGGSVALAADTLAVGAIFETGTGKGVDADPQMRSTARTGAVYVYQRGAQWSPQAYLKAEHPTGLGDFGISLALSGDLLAVGAIFDGPGLDPGAASLFGNAGGHWVQVGHIGASNADVSDQYGTSVALSNDTLVVGAPLEASAATGIPAGGQSDNSATQAGAIYLYR